MIALLLGSLEDGMRSNGTFYQKLLLRHYPEWCKTIRSTTRGAPLTKSTFVAAFRARKSQVQAQWGKRWERRVVRPLFGKRTSDYGYSVGDYGRLLRGIEPLVHEILRRGMLADYVLLGLASKSLRNAASSGKILGVTKLLTFEFYLRQVEGVPSSVCDTKDESMLAATFGRTI